MTNTTAWDRVLKSLKEYEDKHNDDNAVPVFSPSPVDVRTLIQEHTAMLMLLEKVDKYLRELTEDGYGAYPNDPLGEQIVATVNKIADHA